jgi:hypothetical protein
LQRLIGQYRRFLWPHHNVEHQEIAFSLKR